jgi:hypothetical protein
MVCFPRLCSNQTLTRVRGDLISALVMERWAGRRLMLPLDSTLRREGYTGVLRHEMYAPPGHTFLRSAFGRYC